MFSLVSRGQREEKNARTICLSLVTRAKSVAQEQLNVCQATPGEVAHMALIFPSS
jgi:hypothetical protein